MVFVVENYVNVNDTLELITMHRFGDFASKACETLPKLRLAKTCDVCNYKPKSQNGTPFSACNNNNNNNKKACFNSAADQNLAGIETFDISGVSVSVARATTPRFLS